MIVQEDEDEDEDKNKDKEEVEIYCLENSKYIIQKNSQDVSFTFSFSDNCKIDVLLKNICE